MWKHALTRSPAYLRTYIHKRTHTYYSQTTTSIYDGTLYTIKFSQGSEEWIKRRSQKRAGGKKIASKALFINLTVRSTQHSTWWNECKRANLSWVTKWNKGRAREGERVKCNIRKENPWHRIVDKIDMYWIFVFMLHKLYWYCDTHKMHFHLVVVSKKESKKETTDTKRMM